jgi:hypothetical protein
LNEAKLIAELDKLKEEIENSTINKSFVSYRFDTQNISIDVTLQIGEQEKEAFSELIAIIDKLTTKGFKIDEIGRAKTYDYSGDYAPEYSLYAIKRRNMM